MALIVEDGTGRVDAESFLSVADADTYHTNHGNAAWAGASNVKEAALRKATDYMEQMFRLRWVSFRTTSTQRLSWPRAWVPVPDAPVGYGSWSAYVNNNVVPPEVQSACAELALRVIVDVDLNPPLERSTIREKVGSLEVEYDRFAGQNRQYRSVEQMLAAYLQRSPNAARLMRT